MLADGVLVRFVARETRATRTLAASGPLVESWLHPRERDELGRYRHPDRREAWLAGRILSKQLLMHVLPDVSEPATVEICSRDRAGSHIRPEIRVAGCRVPGCLSISHSAGGVLAALSLNPQVRVGVDLTPVENRSPGFLRLWFTEREQQRLRARGPREAARCWAAKEAAYKAVNDGEPFAPRQVEIVWGDEAGSCLSCQVTRQGLTSACLIETSSYGGEITAVAVWRCPRLEIHPPAIVKHVLHEGAVPAEWPGA